MLKALIIDEGVDRWFSLSSVLRQNRIKTNFVNNVFAARQSLEREKPGVLFCDTDVEAAYDKFIKFVRLHYPAIKIVMVKNSAAPGKAAACEADLFISKPFDTEVINEAIKTIL